MARLTDTPLVILSTASRRDDRGVDLPTNVTGEALREAVDKLIRTGLLEEVRHPIVDTVAHPDYVTAERSHGRDKAGIGHTVQTGEQLNAG
jgi:hypothetical protein